MNGKSTDTSSVPNSNEKQEQQPTFAKGMTLDTIMSKFGQKLSTEKNKAFEQKFLAKYKELDAAEAISRGIRKELEKMFTEHTEGL